MWKLHRCRESGGCTRLKYTVQSGISAFSIQERDLHLKLHWSTV